MHTAHGAGFLLFSILIFVFATTESVHRCRHVARKLVRQIAVNKCHPRKMVVISVLLAVSGLISLGPAGYYGLNLLAALGWIAIA